VAGGFLWFELGFSGELTETEPVRESCGSFPAGVLGPGGLLRRREAQCQLLGVLAQSELLLFPVCNLLLVVGVRPELQKKVVLRRGVPVKSVGSPASLEGS
jgi:hypothetical protein